MNHMKHLLLEATDGKAALNSQLKKSEERASQLKQDMARKQALMRGKNGADNVNREQSKDRGQEQRMHSM